MNTAPNVDAPMKRLFDPWRSPAALWQAITYSVLAMPLGIITFSFTVTLLALSAGLLVTFLLALPVVWMLFATSHVFARVERSRVEALMGVRLDDPVPPLVGTSWGRRLSERVRSKPRWREIAHHLALLPVGVFAFVMTSVAWCGPLALAGMPAYVGALPEDSAKFYFFEVHQGGQAVATGALGVVALVFISPWITVALARMLLSMARSLLGPNRDAAMAAQVTRLETSRSAAVDSAEAERRRIERDLHDGAQQRLVALAAGLGAAKEKLEGGDAEGGRSMVAEAHEEAKAALKEIRDLVRGIHPVILEDRGLDAALSAVVARAPVPVRLDVRVAPRPPAAVESAAYFVVNEALTNVARHAQSTRASVSIARAGDRLVVEIRDDGVGGADASRGTGLQGLRDRVSALGGTMHVISPDGGPTTISVELPCGS
jgi:signal transduction histidine kinase